MSEPNKVRRKEMRYSPIFSAVAQFAKAVARSVFCEGLHGKAQFAEAVRRSVFCVGGKVERSLRNGPPKPEF